MATQRKSAVESAVSLVERIAAAHYVATDAQVEALAQQRYTAADVQGKTDGTYLRVLIVACKSKLGTRGRSPSTESQLQVLDAEHTRLYAFVLRGVTTPEVAAEEGLSPQESGARALERNRRSGFARSAYSTVRAVIAAGGDFRGLDPETVSKASLRSMLAPPEPSDKGERLVSRSQSSFLRAIERMARRDLARARALAEGLLTRLQEWLEQDTHDGARGSDPPTTRTRAGVPMLHRPAGLAAGAR